MTRPTTSWTQDIYQRILAYIDIFIDAKARRTDEPTNDDA